MASQHEKVSPELRHQDSGKPVDVIVQYTSTPTDAHIAKATAKGASLKYRLQGIKSAAYRNLPASAVAKLAADPDVAHISIDHPVKSTSNLDYAPETVNAPLARQQFGVDGSGVGVAVIDSGVTAVGDLYWWNPTTGAYGSRVVYSQNFVDSTTDATDHYGHGTHVAGLIASHGWFSTGSMFSHTFMGIAPNANIINLRALDANGVGTDSSVIAAIQAAIDLKSKYNIRVINLSLGRQVYESYTVDPLCQEVEAAWNAGIVVVVAAGNEGRNDTADGYGTVAAPGNDPYVITVGAMKTEGTPDRSDDEIASYSSKGPTAFDHIVKPDIVAPGNEVVSTQAPDAALLTTSTDVLMGEYAYAPATTTTTTSTKNGNGNNKKNNSSSNSTDSFSNFTATTISPSYMRLSGTSMATPIVSGAATLMLQADPTLTPDTVKARLMKSATKTFPSNSTTWTDPTTGQTVTSYYDAFTVGAGYLDIEGAMLNQDAVPAGFSAKSPSANYDPSTGSVYLVSDQSVLWGSSVLWSSSVVWGASVFSGATVNGQSVLWGNSVVWGDSTQDGFSVLWGASVLWSTSTQADSLSVVTKGEN